MKMIVEKIMIYQELCYFFQGNWEAYFKLAEEFM